MLNFGFYFFLCILLGFVDDFYLGNLGNIFYKDKDFNGSCNSWMV